MLKVTNNASAELAKVLASDMAKGKSLILYFAGATCSGPQVGMTLDESVDNLDKLDSNGITAYIDPRLHGELSKLGDINVDFITNDLGQSGYVVSVGELCAGCAGCSCDDKPAN